MAKVKLFKTKHKYLTTSIRGFGKISFVGGMFATDDPDLEAAVNKLIKDKAMKVYIDPKQPEVDYAEFSNPAARKNLEVKLYQKDLDSQKLGNIGGNVGTKTVEIQNLHKAASSEAAKSEAKVPARFKGVINTAKK